MIIKPGNGHPNNSQPIGLLLDIVSDANNSIVVDTGKQILSILESEDQNIIADNQVRFNELFKKLELEVNGIYSGVGYNYEIKDYERRLLHYNLQPHDVLNQLFKRYPNIQIINANILNIFEGSSKLLMQNILFKNYYEDIFLESLELDIEESDHFDVESFDYLIKSLKYCKDCGTKTLSFFFSGKYDFNINPQKRIEFIKIAGDSGITKIDFSSKTNFFVNIFGQDYNSFILFIKTAGESGITSINISTNRLFDIFKDNPRAIIEFIKTAGESGIKHISFRICYLHLFFEKDNDLLIEFIKTAGNSGIKSLDLSSNLLSNIFVNNENFLINFIKTAGESGIKNIDINDTEFAELFMEKPELLLNFIKTAGESGIKMFSITSNTLGLLFDKHPQVLLDFIIIAGKSGIRNLNLKNQPHLYVMFNNNLDFFEQLLITLFDSGIKNLDITYRYSAQVAYTYNPDRKKEIQELLNELSRKGINFSYGLEEI